METARANVQVGRVVQCTQMVAPFAAVGMRERKAVSTVLFQHIQDACTILSVGGV